jgi:GT2 family glycosyltransferase
VIIACYNGAETLAETLASLTAQAWDGSWELLLADNGSTDASAAIFAGFARANPGVRMRLVDAGQAKGKSHALNVGIRAARGDSLLFCDADDTMAPGWLAAMAAALERHAFVAARMDIRSLNPDWTVGHRRQAQEHGLGTLVHAPHCRLAAGSTLGFRRAVFDAVGGFDPAFVALEDIDFCVRAHLAGFRLQFVPDAVVNYRFRDTLAGIYRQGYAYAHWRALLRRRYAAGPLLAPRPWLSLAARLSRLQLRRLVWALRRRPPPLSQQAYLHRVLGQTRGELSGALAFRVAPPRPRPRERPAMSSAPAAAEAY